MNIDRETVAKYIRASACVPKPAKAPIGSAIVVEGATDAPQSPLPAVPSLDQRDSETSASFPLSDALPDNSKPAKAPIGSEGVGAISKGSESATDPQGGIGASVTVVSMPKEGGRSACESYRQTILEKLDQGLSAQRIYQDLVDAGFNRAYHSVRRFVARLRKTSPLPFRRMECASGEEMMTSNRPLEDWGKLIGDVPAAGAILDRFLHHAAVINITGRSYRLRSQAGQSPDAKEKAPSAKEGKRSRRETPQAPPTEVRPQLAEIRNEPVTLQSTNPTGWF